MLALVVAATAEELTAVSNAICGAVQDCKVFSFSDPLLALRSIQNESVDAREDPCVHPQAEELRLPHAVIEWDNQLGSWTEIEHCPSPAELQENLRSHNICFLEYCFTAGKRNLTDEEKNHIYIQQSIIEQRFSDLY